MSGKSSAYTAFKWMLVHFLRVLQKSTWGKPVKRTINSPCQTCKQMFGSKVFVSLHTSTQS